MRTETEASWNVRSRGRKAFLVAGGLVLALGTAAVEPSARASGPAVQRPSVSEARKLPCFPCSLLDYAAEWIAMAGSGVETQRIAAERLVDLSREVARVGVTRIQAAVTFTESHWANQTVGWMSLLRSGGPSRGRVNRPQRVPPEDAFFTLSLAGGGAPGKHGSFSIMEPGHAAETGILAASARREGVDSWLSTDAFAGEDQGAASGALPVGIISNQELTPRGSLLADGAALPMFRFGTALPSALSPALPLEVAFRFFNLLEQQLEAALAGCIAAPAAVGIGNAAWIRGVLTQLAAVREQCARAIQASRRISVSLDASTSFLRSLAISTRGPSAAQSTIELGQVPPEGGAGARLWAQIETPPTEPVRHAAPNGDVLSLSTLMLPENRVAIEVHRTRDGQAPEHRVVVAPHGRVSTTRKPQVMRESLGLLTGGRSRILSFGARGRST